jgi:hypothetical protein
VLHCGLGVDNGPGWVGMGPNCRTGPIHGWIKTAHTEPFLGLGSFGFGSNGFGLNGWFFAGWVSCSPIFFFCLFFKIGVFYGPVVIFLTSQYGQSSNNQNWVPVHDHFLNWLFIMSFFFYKIQIGQFLLSSINYSSFNLIYITIHQNN